MAQDEMPIELLPAWSALNGVGFFGTQVESVKDKGFGIVAQQDMGCNEPFNLEKSFTVTEVLQVSHEAVLSAEAVIDYAKADGNFGELLVTLGYRGNTESPRMKILIFIIAQLSHMRNSTSNSKRVTPTVWTEYIKFFPKKLLLPSTWTAAERTLLQGTSIEEAVEAKVRSLNSEFNTLQEKSKDVVFWNDVFWNAEHPITLDDWVLADAWFRSRCLELPQSGISLIPVIDMANHSATPNAYYREESNRDVTLLLRPGHSVSTNGEVLLSYGRDKSAGEFLFSYGFVDAATDSSASHIMLPIKPLSDDPLAAAKRFAFRGPQVVSISLTTRAGIQWTSPFGFLMVLNFEDGLELRMAQQLDGSETLCIYWDGRDMTAQMDALEGFLRASHPLYAIFRLRVVVVLHDILEKRIDEMKAVHSDEMKKMVDLGLVRGECVEVAASLRQQEITLLERTLGALREEREELFEDDMIKMFIEAEKPNAEESK